MRPTLSHLPCFRVIITQASLYRDQYAPNPNFSRRWQNMDLKELDPSSWVPGKAPRTVSVTHVCLDRNGGDRGYDVAVREYLPLPGDRTYESWRSKATDEQTRHECPRYAIADMRQTAEVMKAYLFQPDVARKYIDGIVGGLDPLIAMTYNEAFAYSIESTVSAFTPRNRSVTSCPFRLCRFLPPSFSIVPSGPPLHHNCPMSSFVVIHVCISVARALHHAGLQVCQASRSACMLLIDAPAAPKFDRASYIYTFMLRPIKPSVLLIHQYTQSPSTTPPLSTRHIYPRDKPPSPPLFFSPLATLRIFIPLTTTRRTKPSGRS